MPDILIRNVSNATALALRARAKRNHRSLQAEALATLALGLKPSGTSFHAKIRELHAEGKSRLDPTAALAALLEDRSR